MQPMGVDAAWATIVGDEPIVVAVSRTCFFASTGVDAVWANMFGVKLIVDAFRSKHVGESKVPFVDSYWKVGWSQPPQLFLRRGVALRKTFVALRKI